MMNNAKKVGILALSAAMLAGCGGSSSNSKSTTFRFASDTDILSMDTDVATDGTSFDAIHAITDGLEIFDAKGNTAAGIAKSYDVNKKKTVYTFHLRDANWVDYNGKKYAKVTANDFVYGWQRILKREKVLLEWLWKSSISPRHLKAERSPAKLKSLRSMARESSSM